ncbi:HNH endonuclease [Gordonia soli]|uniref:HNH nuclease domain-containing protein n=1 Tax=Gordonia soli NBRC 108243 TaxID=1223545 RepID=M0QR34_9ACTN|nr:HNH endonuclease [Gordonia soli]GAC71068.1 hypothetical protein GS4_51_00060 [Gordonia soli NBRC 108243]
MPVSKRLRYEILRRDNHACRYCGASAPDVSLVVDHVVPVALGGLDDPANLVTACHDCNGGKSAASPDAPLVAQVADDAVRWSAAMCRAAEELRNSEVRREWIYEAIDAAWYRGSRPDDWTNSIDNFLNAGLPSEAIVRLVHIAQNKRGDMGYRWSYFCGCCWKRIREMQGRAATYVARDESAPAPADNDTVGSMPTTWGAADITVRVREALTLYESVNGKATTVDEMMSCEHADYMEHCGDPACLIYQAGILVGFLRGTRREVSRGA